MSGLGELNLAVLQDAIAGDYPAIRRITRLQPAGGKGDKIFPPTYMKEGRAETKYAFEKRRIDGEEVICVLLDSVASQANRMEEALLEGWHRGELRCFPLIQVDFSAAQIGSYGLILQCVPIARALPKPQHLCFPAIPMKYGGYSSRRLPSLCLSPKLIPRECL